MSKWITDREPTAADANNAYVWVTTEHGTVLRQGWGCVVRGRPWQPIVPPEPYVKAKRWDVRKLDYCDEWYVIECKSGDVRSYAVPTREAAERIAAIYEEVMP